MSDLRNERILFSQLPDSPISKFKPTATPDVTNGKVFDCCGSAVFITDFLGGQDGQVIIIRGDGLTTVVDGDRIKLRADIDSKILEEGKLYFFVYFNADRVWEELSLLVQSQESPTDFIMITDDGDFDFTLSSG